MKTATRLEKERSVLDPLFGSSGVDSEDMGGGTERRRFGILFKVMAVQHCHVNAWHRHRHPHYPPQPSPPLIPPDA